MDEKLKEDLKPIDTLHNGGIVTKVHLVRTFSGRREYHFEFGRYETDRKRFFFKPVFSEHDLLELEEAIMLAREYRELNERAQREACGGFAKGSYGTMPSKAHLSRLPARWSQPQSG